MHLQTCIIDKARLNLFRLNLTILNDLMTLQSTTFISHFSVIIYQSYFPASGHSSDPGTHQNRFSQIRLILINKVKIELSSIQIIYILFVEKNSSNPTKNQFDIIFIFYKTCFLCRNLTKFIWLTKNEPIRNDCGFAMI